MRPLFVATMLSLLALLVAVGCGGSGGSTSGGGNSSVNVFVTDGFDDTYDSVWVRLHEIRLTRTGGGPVTVFQDATGVVTDLRRLNDGQARFQYLVQGTVPAGTYNGVEIVLDKNVVLVPKGQSNGQETEMEDSLDDSAGKSKVKVSFAQPLAVGAGQNDLILDFVLSRWQIVGGKIRPFVDKHDGNGFDNNGRHDDNDHSGSLSGLSGTPPSQTFTLTVGNGRTIEVTTNANTVIVNEDGSSNPSLANGQKVEVRGAFQPSSRSVLAKFIKIEDGSGSDDDDKVKGAVISQSEGECEVVVDASLVRGFVPNGKEVKVRGSDTTVFWSDSGTVITKTEFFAGLATSTVEAEGTYDATTNVLNAKKMKLDDKSQGGGHDEAEAKGHTSNVDAGAGTFDMTLDFWQGFNGSQGQVVNVTMNANATYRDSNGAPIDKAAFFGLIAGGARVEVEGRANGSTFQAKKAKVEDDGGGMEDPVEVRGAATAINAPGHSLSIVLTEWFGMDGSVGQVLPVETTANTTYRGLNGEDMNADDFFAAVTDGHPVEAEGLLVGGTLRAKKLKLED